MAMMQEQHDRQFRRIAELETAIHVRRHGAESACAVRLRGGPDAETCGARAV